MSPIESVFSASFSQALGWTLLHFVWQGTLVAAALWAALRLLRRHTARLRYGVACAALGVLLLLPVMTLVWHMQPEVAGDVAPAGLSLLTQEPTATVAMPEEGGMASGWDAWLSGRLAYGLPWLLTVWMAGVFVLSFRWFMGGLYAVRLRRRGHREVGQKWQQMLAALSARMGLRRAVGLYTSSRVRVPTVVGWLRPVVLLPVSVFTGLSPQQIEMILAHELAHIRRHDYLVNLLQTISETLLFYHPGVWWVSRQVRIEREHCCDDLVVAVCGDAFTYAEALTKLEQVRHPRPALVLAATDGSLLHRIRRLLSTPAETTTRSARWTAGLVLLGALLVGVYVATPIQAVWQKATGPFDSPQAPHQVRVRHKVKLEPVVKIRPVIKIAPIEIDPITIDPITIDPIRVGPITVDPVIIAPITVTIPEGFERVESAYGVGNTDVVQEVDAVVERYRESLSSSISFVRRQAVEDLARTGDRSLPPVLERIAFEDASASVQMEALDGLRNLPRGSGINPLVRIAETHPRAAMRNEAVQWLGRLGAVKAVPVLERLAFQDASASVQMEALDALRTLPDGAGREALEGIARSHPRRTMRSEAAEWLGRL